MSSDFLKDSSPKDSSQRTSWHPSRLLVAEEWILCAAIAAVGAVYAYSLLPKPSVPAAVAASMRHLHSPFAGVPAGQTPVALVSVCQPMIDSIKRAQGREARGIFDDATREAWSAAAAEVNRLGMLPISTGHDTYVRLFMREAEESRAKAIEELLEELVPGRFAALQEQRANAVAAAPEFASTMPEVTWSMVAAAAPADVREMALGLVALHANACLNAKVIARYRDLVGYDYWKSVCQSGASAPGIEARAAIWQAEFDASQSQLEQAKTAFERGFIAWRQACDIVPALETNADVAGEMAQHRERYREVLVALDEAAATGGRPAIDL